MQEKEWGLNDFTGEFFNSQVENICLSGEFGSGKTSVACLKMHAILKKYPKNIGLVLRNINDDLMISTIPEYLEVCFQDRHGVPQGYYYNRNEKHIIYPNGSELWFMALDNEKMMRKLKGLKLGALWADQVEEVDEKIFNLACGRVRHNVPVRQKFFTCNPEGGDHFIKNLFFARPIKTKKESLEISGNKYPIEYGYWQGQNEKYLGITAKPMANAANLPEGYYQDMIERFPHEWVMKYVFANWFGKSGLIYPFGDDNIVRQANYIDMNEVNDFWLLYQGQDYGISEENPMVWLWILRDIQKNYYVINEYYEYSEGIKHCSDHVNHVNAEFTIGTQNAVGCPRTFQREGASDKRGGVSFKTPAMLFQEFGLNLTPYPIHFDVRQPVISKLFETGRLKVYERCRNLIKELQGYKWRTLGKSSDHAIEALERTVSKMEIYGSGRDIAEYNKRNVKKNARPMTANLLGADF